jgi:dihydropteroate synthase
MNTRIMGILNVTPDSFSDGGKFVSLDAAVARANQMIAEGADLIDIGGESTRPGAQPVDTATELERVVPVIEAIRKQHLNVEISIDTMKTAVAAKALEAGATLVNDVSAGGDDGMLTLTAEAGAHICLMHMRGEPRTMQKNPVYQNVVDDVKTFLAARVQAAVNAGIDKSKIYVDPGIGFGKTVEHNLSLLRNMREFHDLGRGVLVGASRKTFIGAILGGDPDDRLEGSLAAAAWAAFQGAAIVRVHDVAETAKVLRMIHSISGAS